MDIKRLLHLADQDDILLAKYAKRWCNNRQSDDSEDKTGKDPVVLALEYRARYLDYYKRAIIAFAFAVIFTFVLGYLAESNLETSMPGVLLLISIIVTVLISTTNLIQAVNTMWKWIPHDTRLFLKAVTLVENAPRVNCGSESDGNQCVGPMSSCGSNAWYTDSEIYRTGMQLLTSIAREKQMLERRRDDIPWRKAFVDIQIEEKGQEFRSKHYLLRRLISVPVDWKYYFPE